MRVPEYIARMEKDNVDHRYRAKRLVWHERRVFVEEFAIKVTEELEAKSVAELRAELRVLEYRRGVLSQAQKFLSHPDMVQLYQQHIILCEAIAAAERHQTVLQKMFRSANKNTTFLMSHLKKAATKLCVLRKEAESLETEINQRCQALGLQFCIVVLGITSAKRPEVTDES
jgi:hypothetical protein